MDSEPENVVLTAGDSQAENPIKEVSPPIQWWKIWLLCMATFGIYPVFWMHRAARDLKTLDERRRTPWLWLLSPLLAISLPFSMARLYERFAALGNRPGRWRARGALLGLAGFIIALGIRTTDRIEVPAFATLVLLILWSMVFAIPQRLINDTKEKLPRLAYRGKANRLSTLQRVCLWLCGPVSALLFAGLFYSDLAKPRGEALQAASTFTDPEGRFRFDIPGDDWSLVPVGALSDGTTELEIQGRFNEMWVLIFAYHSTETLDTLVRNRTELMREALSSPDCREKRHFQGSTLNVVATVTCRGNLLGTPELETARIIETLDGYFEMYGHVSAAEVSFRTASKDLRTMVSSFTIP